MGVLKWGILALVTACSSKPPLAEKTTDTDIVVSALKLQNARDWQGAEKQWNKLSPASAYFPQAYYETQKLSYRREDWNTFFAKAEIYQRAFQGKLYCPELFLLQSFAYTRNCLFDEAQNSLNEATRNLEKPLPSQCSKMTKASMQKQIDELSSVLRANQKLKVTAPVEAANDPLKRNLWPVNDAMFHKIQNMPLEEGLSLVGVEVKNKCGS